MSYADNNPYSAGIGTLAAQADVNERAEFITKTYTHLAGAVSAFVGIEYLLLNYFPANEQLVATMTGGWSWLIVLGAFMLVSYVAQSWAMSATSIGKQYAGLSLYVVAQSVITLPLLWVAQNFAPPGVIPTAAVITLVLFGGLTAIVFVTRYDFSFLRGILMLCGLVAMGVIACSILFGFNLGMLFTSLMIAFACGYILYDTSNVLHHYRIGQHVAAALALFASAVLLFWYVLRLVMASRD